MIFIQSTVEDATEDQSIPQDSQSLGSSPHPTFAPRIPTTDICKGSSIGPSTTCLSFPHESMPILLLTLFNSLVGKQSSHMKLGLHYKPNPGKWVEGSRFH